MNDLQKQFPKALRDIFGELLGDTHPPMSFLPNGPDPEWGVWSYELGAVSDIRAEVSGPDGLILSFRHRGHADTYRATQVGEVYLWLQEAKTHFPGWDVLNDTRYSVQTEMGKMVGEPRHRWTFNKWTERFEFGQGGPKRTIMEVLVQIHEFEDALKGYGIRNWTVPNCWMPTSEGFSVTHPHAHGLIMAHVHHDTSKKGRWIAVDVRRQAATLFDSLLPAMCLAEAWLP